MTALNTAIDDFHFGETIEFTVAAKNRDGTVITSAGAQTMTVMISSTEGGTALLTFNASPQVVLSDAGNGIWLITLEAADYTGALTEGEPYNYFITTTLSSDDPIVQAHGLLIPKPSPLA